MKTVSGRVLSSKPISLSKAASTLSSFLSTDNGASPAICAYLRRASVSFNELKQLHKELRSSRSDRNHRNHKLEIVSGVEGVGDNPNRSEVSRELSHRTGDGENKTSSVSESRSRKKRRVVETNRDLTEGKPTGNRSGQESSRGIEKNEPVDGERPKDGKTVMVSGKTDDFPDVVGEDGKRRGELKTEIEDNPARRVELDKESSGRDKSTVAFEKKRKKHKKKSEDEIGKIGGSEREAGARESDRRLRIGDDNGVVYGVGANERIKIEVAENLVESVEIGQRSSSVIENNAATGKNRKKHEDNMHVDDEKGQVKGEGQTRRDNEEDKGNDDVKVHVELSTEKKKKKKQREQVVEYLLNDGRGAMEKEGMQVLDSGESKREEVKKRKNRDVIEGGNDGSVEQQHMKRRKKTE